MVLSLAAQKFLDHPYEEAFQFSYCSVLSADLGSLLPLTSVAKELYSSLQKNWFMYYKNDLGTMYYKKSELKAIQKITRDHFLDDSWFSGYINEVQELYKKASDFFIHSSPSLERLSDAQLCKLIEEIAFLQIRIFAYYTACQPQYTYILENMLEDAIIQIVGEDQAMDVLLKLLHSSKPTLLDEEENAWLLLCSNSLSNKALTEALERHASLYGILGTSHTGHFYTVDHYSKLHYQTNAEKAKQKLAQKERAIINSEEEKRKIISKYKFNKNIIDLSQKLSYVGHERFELRMRGWMMLDYWFIYTLIPYISQRFGVSIENLKQLRLEELILFVRTKKMPAGDVASRGNCYIVGSQDGSPFILYGSAAEEKAKTILPPHPSTINEITGSIAYQGKVTGKAYVLHYTSASIHEEIEAMPKGSIVIAGQTRPHLMPALRKAGAIVTDEGGITSHAAIVAREMKKPCVIGTKIATKIIKTGDIIEVDADNGIVKILER